MGILSGIADIGMAAFNIGHQTDLLNFQKDKQKQSWEREDTATQRRVADLKAAGLSPTLAAGSAAQTSSPINLKAPQIAFSAQQAEQNINNMKLQKRTIDKTQAEVNRVKAEEQSYINTAELAKTKNLIALHDLGLLNTTQSGFRSNQTGGGASTIGTIDSVAQQLSKILGGDKNSLENGTTPYLDSGVTNNGLIDQLPDSWKYSPEERFIQNVPEGNKPPPQQMMSEKEKIIQSIIVDYQKSNNEPFKSTVTLKNGNYHVKSAFGTQIIPKQIADAMSQHQRDILGIK